MLMQAQGGAQPSWQPTAYPTYGHGMQGNGLAQLIAMMMQGQGGQPGFANMLTRQTGPGFGGMAADNQLMRAQMPRSTPSFSGLWR